MSLFRDEATKALAQKAAELLVNVAGAGLLALFGFTEIKAPPWLYPYQPYWAEAHGFWLWGFGAMFVLGALLCLWRRGHVAALLFLLWLFAFLAFREGFVCDAYACVLTGWIAYGMTAALAAPVLAWLAAAALGRL